MNLDLGSFAFGSSIESGGGTPSWGTALGQSKPDYKFTYPGSEILLVGMAYCAVPLEFVSFPLGKGGRIYKGNELNECLLASLFRKVYVNGIQIGYPFLVALIKEESESHFGRRSIKYSDKNEYKSSDEFYTNKEFIRIARQKLNISDDACWFVYSMDVYNQDELHMSAVVVDENNNITYENSSERKTKWLELIASTDIDYKIYNVDEKQITDNQVLQQIYYGAPGTGKSHEINQLTKGKEVVRTTFHPDSDYSTFVGAYKPTSIEIPVRDVTGKVIVEGGKQVTENRIVYEFVDQAFLQAYIKAWNAYIDASEEEKPKDIFLVIEEINRGNCAQIFGDLFQLLDRNGAGFSDYPIQADKDMKKQLAKAFSGKNIADAERINNIYEEDIVAQVLSGEKLLLPDNLYIWATMNTSDQSLFPIDSAFKRRWDWQYTPICEGKSNDGQPLGWKIKANGNEYDWWTFIQKINAEIEEMTKSEDKKLGYFFCKPINGIISAETFVGKVIFYLWNDVFKDQDLGSIFYDNEGNELTFNSFYGVDNYGKAVVKEEPVEMFLNNLDLKPIGGEIIDETK